MLKEIREQVITSLWNRYQQSNQHIQRIQQKLLEQHAQLPILDHLAIIDLPGTHTGISELKRIFSAIGFSLQGEGYLPEKQNDFVWLAASDSNGAPASTVLPQIVVADFRPDELPTSVRDIVLKYSCQAPPSPAAEIEALAQQAAGHNKQAAELLLQRIHSYLSGRDWPLPTVSEFETVRACNELIAWVLVFGRRPNHFTFSIHLLPEFKNLTSFHHFIENDVGLPLNHDGGVIKGGRHTGIEQGSTAGTPEKIELADGEVNLPTGFVEFVWRFQNKSQPVLWDDYYTGFVANHANHVIQSLYTKETA